MTTAGIEQTLRAVTGLDVASAGLAEVTAALGAIRRLEGFLAARSVALARRAAELSPIPERVVATASGTSDRSAMAVLDRVAVVDQVPALGAALTDGTIGAGHVDWFGKALRSMDPDRRPQLVSATPDLLERAGRASSEEFGRLVRAEVRRIDADHGVAQLERQKRACRVSTWVDTDGMWRLTAQFDPVTGAHLADRLSGALATLEAASPPAEAPDDPLERRSFLRAHALAHLISGARGVGPRGGIGELLFVVDGTRLDADGQPTIDWGIPVEIPAVVLVDLYNSGKLGRVTPVIVHNGAVLYAPGTMNLGRTTRLASRDQRRALRALYPTCAIPDCPARFADCDIHHVIWWEAPHNGPTDLDNLLPLCGRHHHCVHDRGWRLTLSGDRTLTISYPERYDPSCTTDDSVCRSRDDGVTVPSARAQVEELTCGELPKLGP